MDSGCPTFSFTIYDKRLTIFMKSRDKMRSVRLAPYRRALERVGAALRAKGGGPSDREMLEELRKKLFGADAIESIKKSEAKARAESEPDGPTGSTECEVRSAESAEGPGEGPECPELSHEPGP
jgi:hypothetical protein